MQEQQGFSLVEVLLSLALLVSLATVFLQQQGKISKFLAQLQRSMQSKHTKNNQTEKMLLSKPGSFY